MPGTLPALAIVGAIALGIIGHWPVFDKAGEDGRNVLIPGYNLYVLYKITWGDDRAWIPMTVNGVSLAAGGITAALRGIITAYVPFGIWVMAGIFLLLAVVTLIFWVQTMQRLAAAFNQDDRFALGLIFLYPVYLFILGYGDKDYYGPL